jgi:hypothetical protein
MANDENGRPIREIDVEIISVTDFCPLKKKVGIAKIDTEYFELIKLRKIYFDNILKIVEKFNG